jgi:hypothetical protein
LQPAHELGEPLVSASDVEGRAARLEVYIEAVLGNVDPHEE